VTEPGTELTWDSFLTEQDKDHLAATWSKTEPFGFGSKPALLIIDDYYTALGTRREPLLESVKSWPMSCGLEGWAAIDRTVPLLQAARDNGIPVIFVKGVDGGFPSPWGRPAHQRRKPETMPPPEELARGNDIVDELAPLPGELVIQKAAPSSFSGTTLQYHLTYLGIDTVIACGETTSGCVRASVVDGATARYRMGVVADCCFDRTQASHFINLYDMHQKYGDVLTSGGAIEYFRSIGEASQVARLDAGNEAANVVAAPQVSGVTVGAASS
jgi:nicotinamidase-related amidase